MAPFAVAVAVAVAVAALPELLLILLTMTALLLTMMNCSKYVRVFNLQRFHNGQKINKVVRVRVIGVQWSLKKFRRRNISTRGAGKGEVLGTMMDIIMPMIGCVNNQVLS